MESNGQIVEETGSVLQSFSENMEQIHTSTNECKEIIWKLGEESKKILGIINVITGISNQTNILALNASIEAARAGEQSRSRDDRGYGSQDQGTGGQCRKMTICSSQR